MKNVLMIGQIIKPQGVRGEIKVKPMTDDPERFAQLAGVYLDEEATRCVGVVSARTREGYVYLMLEGLETCEDAEPLRGLYLYVDRAQAAKLPAGRYFIADMIGMKVVSDAGPELGKLYDVLQAGGSDVYDVRGPRNFLFPALKKVLLNIEVESGVMTLCIEELEKVVVYQDED